MPSPNEQNFNPTPTGDRMTIVCLYCNKPQEVSARAQSISCKFCYKRLTLKDEAINQHASKKSVETLGMVTVEKKGNLIANPILCGGLIVRGKVKGNVKSRGPVLVGPEAEIKGDVSAPTLAVGAGAVLEGKYAIGAKYLQQQKADAEVDSRPLPEPEDL